VRESLPRVLIVAVNPLSETSNNGKTYASFFQGYPAERIAQLYFHRELPDSNVTKRYYRVSDEDVLRFLTRRTRVLGAPVSSTTTADQFLSPSATRTLASSQLIRLARNALLGAVLGLGYPDIKKWLRDFDPQVIFFSGGNATQLYPLVTRISDDFDAPVFNYITDDYVLPRRAGTPTEKFARARVRKHFLRMCTRSSRVLTIGQKMSDVYREQFGIASAPLMNLVELPQAQEEPRGPAGRPIILTYAGGLHLNRWQTLSKIGAALDRIEDAYGPAELHIYTATDLDSSMESSLRSSRRVIVHNAVAASELPAVFAAADLLVHVESFEHRDRAATYLSVSTKIPEYLAAGRAVLAVGPADLASIEYLDRSGAAYVTPSLADDELDRVLGQAVSDHETRSEMGRRGREVVLMNHDAARSRHGLWSAFVEAARLGASTAETSAGAWLSETD
jgi:glycosyltransferase involved in cell wall biosynthesis